MPLLVNICGHWNVVTLQGQASEIMVTSWKLTLVRNMQSASSEHIIKISYVQQL
jgi:hypothetical protein